MRAAFFFLISSWVLIAACRGEAGSQAVAVAPLQAPSAPTTTGVRYVFDQGGSQLTWVGEKVTRKHDGAFQTFSGTIDLVDNEPAKSSVAVDIALGSITTDPAHLVEHLKKPDFFDVEKYTQAHFRSKTIVARSSGGTHTVTGDLDLHGVSKSIEFPATIRVSDSAVDVDAELTINRQDFGIAYPGAPDDLVKDEVPIKLKVHATKAP